MEEFRRQAAAGRAVGFTEWLEEEIAAGRTMTSTMLPPERGLSGPLRRVAAPQFPFDASWAEELLQMEADLFAVMNNDRGSSGLPPLVRDPAADAVARWAAEQRAWAQYLNHVDLIPAGQLGNTTGAEFDRPFGVRFVDLGYMQAGAYAIGENMLYGYTDAASAEAALMSDAGHRGNILNSSYRTVGIGVARSTQNHAPGLAPFPGLIWMVQDFSSKTAGSPPPPPVPSGVVLQAWLHTVLPQIQATSQYQKWAAATTKAGKAEVDRWLAYVASPHGPVPVMTSLYGKALVADLQLAAAQP